LPSIKKNCNKTENWAILAIPDLLEVILRYYRHSKIFCSYYVLHCYL